MDNLENTKTIWQSKTFWINTIAIIGMIVQSQTTFVFDASLQTAILGLINIILRKITNKPINWTKN